MNVDTSFYTAIAGKLFKRDPKEQDFCLKLIQLYNDSFEEIVKSNEYLSKREMDDILNECIFFSRASDILAHILVSGADAPSQDSILNNLSIFQFMLNRVASYVVICFVPDLSFDKLKNISTVKLYHNTDFLFAIIADSQRKIVTNLDTLVTFTKGTNNIYVPTSYINDPEFVEVIDEGSIEFNYIEHPYIKEVYTTNKRLFDYYMKVPSHLYGNTLHFRNIPSAPVVADPDVEMCAPCKKRLKWINLYLQCPDCKRIYG